MDRRFSSADTEEYAEPVSENGPDSPSSGDDMTKTAKPSPKKSKRGVQKRVVSVPIGDVEGSKSKGEAYPPSDSWAWRKYGQKPIKGSPYPRGYYRCSSSKGCPARKQVERSRVDPTTLIITYACNHNHPVPTKSHSSTSAPASATSAAMISDEVLAKTPAEIVVFSGESDIEIGDALLDGYHHQWFDDVASTAVLESPIYGGAYVDADVSTAFSAVSGEDESLFADLGELPECSVVFRRRIVEPEEQNRRCGLSAVTG
ncbi:putative WRKY transcription factor 69 [Morus notabilis]|uniref:Putative WRKY transcription factor 69 n=1 Tax=Morus notabilis TaxID=981085 RepID=W9RQF6_9ROSA|nr:probable WRKY transcription factor 69 [Morus notabilis]EXB92371.1 putative WRKY transcription factor 69 [Morus notabilis]